MKDWKQVLMGLCKVKSIVTLLLTGTFMALALRGDVAAVKFLCDAVREMDAASPQSGACEADDEQGPRPFRLVLEIVDGAEGGSL